MSALSPETRSRSGSPGFQQICARVLELESRSEELLSYRVGRVPFWSLARLAVLLRLEDRVRGESSAGDIYLKARRIGIHRALRYALSSLRRSPFWHAEREVLLVVSGVNRVRESGGLYTNTRVDYFANALGSRRRLLIEGADNNLEYAWPRAISPVSFRGGLTLPAAFRARLNRPTQSEAAAVGRFVSLLRESLDDALAAEDYAQFHDLLARSVVRSRTYAGVCERLLDRTKPKLVFVESAHFGVDVELIAAAHERGIATAECQHGAVNPACPYHNFHPMLLKSGYASCLPRFFLSYGEFWHSFMTTSAELVAIGNPHLEQVRKARRNVTPAPSSVYFLSSAESPQLYMDSMREMTKAGLRVVFRPHPVERPLIQERYGSFFSDMHIDLDVSDDLCGRLQDFETIVGDGRSTSIFEAFALAPGRVAVLERPERIAQWLPSHDFLPTVRSVESLRSHLAASSRHAGASVSDLFAPDWERRFAHFLDRVMSA